MDLLRTRLADAGYEVAAVVPATGGAVADAGLVTLADGRRVFAKTLRSDAAGVFEVEAEGLRAIGDTGTVETPELLSAGPRLLVLSPLEPRRDDSPEFWARLGALVATMHKTNHHRRYGWHRDGWLGRLPQVNTWTDDGHAFFAEHRLLRWLSEPLAEQALDGGDRRALENLCAELPSIVPRSAGDADARRPVAQQRDGRRRRRARRDPPGGVLHVAGGRREHALVCAATAGLAHFFAAYNQVSPLADGWPERAPILFLREQLSAIAHGDDAWGAIQYTRDVIAPFRRR